MKATGLFKTYGGKAVLRAESLSFPRGDITAILGPNGSGKSTLLKLLAGVERPDQPFRREPEDWPQAGYMPQHSFGFKMSLARNLLLGLERTPERLHQAEALAVALGLSGLERIRGDRLSGGETQKLALARLLLRPRGLLLLDEPTSALDPASALTAEKLIQDYCRAVPATVLLVTHSVKQAQRVSRWAVIMDEGWIAEQGDTEAVLTRPRTDAARRFLEFGGG